MGKHRSAPHRLHGPRRAIGANEEACFFGPFSNHQNRAGGKHRHLLHDASVKKRLELAAPARRFAQHHEIVRAEFILVENSVGHIWRRLELEHHAAAFGAFVFNLGVTCGIAPGILVVGFARPALGINAILLQNLECLFQVAHARKFKACLHHVLAGKPYLQATRMQALVDGPHMQDDEIAIIAVGKARGIAHGHISLVGTVNAGQYAEAVAPLRPQVLQGFAHGTFLPVGQLLALEEISHRSNGQ